MTMSITKKELHRLIDALPAKEIDSAGRFLEFLISLDPAVYALHAQK